jgi:hypothetical protein
MTDFLGLSFICGGQLTAPILMQFIFYRNFQSGFINEVYLLDPKSNNNNKNNRANN